MTSENMSQTLQNALREHELLEDDQYLMEYVVVAYASDIEHPEHGRYVVMADNPNRPVHHVVGLLKKGSAIVYDMTSDD